MSYLKLIANALWAGIYGSILITFLLLFLNDEAASPGDTGHLPATFLRMLGPVALCYLPIFGLLFPTLFVFVRFFAARRLGLGWMTLKAIVWFGAAVLGVLCGVFYINTRWAVVLQSPAAHESIRESFSILSVCWLAVVTMAAIGQGRSGVPGHRWRIGAGVALLISVLAMFPMLAQARAATLPGEPSGSVEIGSNDSGNSMVVIGVQAASMNEILPLVTARELPGFEHLLKGGAAARLNSIVPCVSLVAWTTLGTGMPPWATGVKDTHVYALRPMPGATEPVVVSVLPRGLGMGLLTEAGWIRATPARAVRSARPYFWESLRGAGIDSAVTGWPGATAARAAPLPEQSERVSARLERMLEGAAGSGSPEPRPVAMLRRAIAEDLASRDAALAARRSGARVLVVHFPGLGAVSRYFLRFQHPAEFGNVSAQETSQYGKVLARYYGFVDELVAEQAEAAGPSSCIMIVSAHGVEAMPAWERFAREFLGGSGDDLVSGSWRRGPDGLLIVRGAGVAAGTRIEDADILDVVPTMMYLLGLPIERDLKGGLLRRLFRREFLESHPVQLVPGRPRVTPRL